jgi:UPF0755 protein
MKRILLSVIFLALLAALLYSYFLFLAPNINGKRVSIKIPTGSTYDDVLSILANNKVLLNPYTFSVVSKMKDYPSNVKPGYYVFSGSMNNRQIVNILRSGLQTPVTLVIYNIRTKKEFAGLVGRVLELDSTELFAKLNDSKFTKQYGLDTNKILARFISDNYEFYWNVPFTGFMEKMDKAYKMFWNEERRAKARALNLSVAEVTTLASIVEKEVMREKELPTVAGVYINRLRIGMPLQADPTLVFALQDFDARRVNSTHKEYDSPYNTYMHSGLPPGPICIPRKKSIDAVLNYQEHGYLYFCANPDMSGYSIFSKTYQQQMMVAAQYRKQLDKMNVH